MANKYIPTLLLHSPVPKVRDFAMLAGLDACVRGILISVMPLTVYDALGSAESVSQVYFIAGIASLMVGLMVPFATRFVPRRWMYSAGTLLYILGAALAVHGGPIAVPLALIANAAATVTTFVCFNAYVLDYISRSSLSKSQSTNMLYAAAPWAIGPLLGVWLREWWEPLPFLIGGALGLLLLTTFWILRLGNGKQISRARRPAANPLAFIGRFAAQPRLVAGWMFAVVRSCGWWVYVVYLPIFCIENGLGDKVGGIVLSLSNALLFLTPFMLRITTRLTVRRSVKWAFGLCATGFFAAALASPVPMLAVVLMMAASAMLVVLDAVGGLPFLMAVKPSERTEMAAIYSTFRDASGILTPGAAWLVLLVAPLPAVFAVASVAMMACVGVAARLHPRLGQPRPSRGGLMPGE
ncbi:Major Facilitator Superfamily protein [Pseudorhodobacter antarcticus]|uniref:Major Facilitator Superfamily protein n=1 Tax=Pseudorhodobacter antarcticus TaxID=1077947 RepID=A0A1H8IXT7_9RHOB|nr:MFS transporter [Pseudorhodobacter antarcticus]SEN73433.1 Major Facilitator Superfamily protein [Pseudorhodobacter antarcticus]